MTEQQRNTRNAENRKAMRYYKLKRMRRKRIIRKRIFAASAALLILVIIICAFRINGDEDSVKSIKSSGTGKTVSDFYPDFSDNGESEHFTGAAGLSYEEKMAEIKNSGNYPENLVKFAEMYEEAADFVYCYPYLKDEKYETDFSKAAEGDHVPLMIQWDKRWGYIPYSNGYIGNTGCGPVCLSMTAMYLTENSNWTPEKMAEIAMECRHESEADQGGTSWDVIRKSCEYAGLEAQVVPLGKEVIEIELDKGNPLIVNVGPGDFSRGGHYIVITGYDEEGFSVNDPNSLKNSSEKWKFEKICGQIRNIWSISLKK